MKNSFDKLNEVFANHGLRCYQSDSDGDKKITFIGIEGNGFDFNLSLTWHDEIIITDFKGTTNLSNFCKILSELEIEIKKLQL